MKTKEFLPGWVILANAIDAVVSVLFSLPLRKQNKDCHTEKGGKYRCIVEKRSIGERNVEMD